MGRRQRTHEEFLAMVEGAGYKCHNQFRGSHTIMLLECNRGHRYRVEADTFIQGYRCAKCANEKRAKDMVKDSSIYAKRAKKLGYTLLADTFKGSQLPCSYMCPHGHTFQRRPQYLSMGCQQCNKKQK